MKLYASELMELARKEPEKYEGKKYKVVSGSSLGDSSETIRTCVVTKGRICDMRHDVVPIWADTVLEEIPPEPKPVPFMEAAEANEKGKRVECKIYGCFNVYKPTAASGMIDQSGRAVSANEILHGEWFIKGE